MPNDAALWPAPGLVDTRLSTPRLWMVAPKAMGDNWQHRIIVESLNTAEPGTFYPQFLGGERRCPPEDCGGLPGYDEFLDNIASKENKRRKAALNWYGGPYDPDEIDEEEIVAALRRIGNVGRR